MKISMSVCEDYAVLLPFTYSQLVDKHDLAFGLLMICSVWKNVDSKEGSLIDSAGKMACHYDEAGKAHR